LRIFAGKVRLAKPIPGALSLDGGRIPSLRWRSRRPAEAISVGPDVPVEEQVLATDVER